jgi:hypothetical protein
MKTALSGLMVALLVTAVPALAQTSTRHSGGYQRQAASTQTQAQTGTRYSGGRQTASTQTQTGTRYSGSRQAASTQTGSTQTQTGTRYSGGNNWQQQRLAQAPSGTRDSGANFRDHQRQGTTQQGWRSGEQSHVQGQARDIQRERHDGDRRGFGNDGRFQHGQGYAYGRQDNWRDGRFQRGNAYAYGHSRQDNWRNGHQYGNQVRGWDRSIDRREDRQQDRIAQGIRSGELTRHEAQRLMAEQRMIRQEERRYKADGVVTPWERRDLQRDLDAAGRNIYEQTHDAQTRY